MDPFTFMATLLTDPAASYQDINSRLIAAANAAPPSWTPEQVNTVVTIIFGDFDATSLSNSQILQLTLIINGLWPGYPLHNARRHDPNCTRLAILQGYLAGNIDRVADQRRP